VVVSAVLTSTPKVDAGPAGTLAVAIAAAVVGWMATGLPAAVPAGAGLGVLARSDLAAHHISIRTLGVGSGLVALALAVDAAIGQSCGHLMLAVVGTTVVATVLGLAWLSTTGISFGDVLLGAFALAVPLYLSLTATAVTVLVALAAAALYVVVRAARSGARRSITVPLAPALLVGWLCGMVIS
jgi:hypothetical protein